MKKSHCLLGFSAALAMATAAFAQADDCASATSITDGVYAFDTTGMLTTTTGGCFDTSPDVWFMYTPTGNGVLSVSLCGSLYDTALSIWEGGCPGAGVQTFCNDDFCGLQSQIDGIAITAGVPIWIRVHGFSANFGAGTMTVTSNTGGPPANDTCAGAQAIGEGSFPIDTQAATDEGPGASCGFGGDPGSNDAFYLYTPTFTGTARIDTCGSGFDTILQVLTGCGGSELGCNDDACGLQSQTSVAVTAGTPVVIRVSGYFGARGTGTLNIAELTCGVGNDCCATADVVGMGTTAFDTSNATNDGSAACGASGTSPDIWFSFTAPAAATYTIDSCGSTYDTVIALFDTCYGTELVCNDDSCGLQSAVTYAMNAGQTVLIRMAGFGGAVGSGVLNITSCSGITYPSSIVLENEVCGADNNGGCNMATPTFEPMTPGTAVHGTAWANAGTRDTDWFSASFSAGQTVTLCGQAEFPLRLFILDNLCAPTVLATTTGSPCQLATVSFTIPTDGEYHFFAGTQAFDGTPCNVGDVGNNYWISLSTDGSCPSTGPTCSPCVADFNNSGGTPDDADVDAFFTAWSNGDECADANGSGGTPDDADVDTFFTLWSQGGC